MSLQDTALIVIDAQESFRQRDYWNEQEATPFIHRLQQLVDGAKQAGIAVIQVVHVDPSGPFSLASGHVKTLAPLSISPTVVIHKHRHSAFVGSPLGVWLTERGIRRLLVSGIRTEQCCETTTRHASDLGYAVDFVSEATLTFGMTDRTGRTWSGAEIKARTELVLEERFARIVTVDEALSDADVRRAA